MYSTAEADRAKCSMVSSTKNTNSFIYTQALVFSASDSTEHLFAHSYVYSIIAWIHGGAVTPKFIFNINILMFVGTYLNGFRSCYLTLTILLLTITLPSG